MLPVLLPRGEALGEGGWLPVALVRSETLGEGKVLGEADTGDLEG
jgi:hypothetical protein